jgi:hypothetical protein
LFNDSACGRKEFATETRKHRKYSACGRKGFATEAQKHGNVICIFSVFPCFCGNMYLPQANYISAFGRKRFATEAQRQGKVICIFCVSVLLWQQLYLPQANRVSFSIKFVVQWNNENK